MVSDAGHVAITDRIRAAARWAFSSERPASLSLAETKPRADTTEYGSNSVSYAASKDGPARLIDPEYKWQLRGRQGGDMYRRMRWSDPHIWGLRQAQNLPMLQAQATFEPSDPKDKEALAKVELAERLLLNDFPWRSFLQDTLLSFDYGFCVDDQTQALTRDGWKFYSEMRVGDDILTLNPETEQSEWQSVEHLNIFEVNEPLRVLDTRSHSSASTLDHRWVTKSKRTGRIGFKTTDKLNTDDQFITAARCENLPEEATYPDELVELVAWFWTEGTVAAGAVTISQSEVVNPLYCDRIRDVLERAFGPVRASLRYGKSAPEMQPAAWAERKPRRQHREIAWHLNLTASQVLTDIAPDKVVRADFISALTAGQLRLFIRTSIDGDGWRMGERIAIGQNDARRLEPLHMAASLLGIPAVVHEGVNYKGPYWTLRLGKQTHIKPVYAAGRSESSTDAMVPYEGVVWCPTVANGTWYAKRRGTSYFTGNCCFEIVWRIEDGEARCRLALRPSSSIWVENIHVKNGAIDHIVQRPIDGGERTIPGEKLVWFAHQKEGDSFTGRSIMRPMYKPWSIKEELEIELAILVRKGGGVPDIETDEEPDKETGDKLDDMGRRFGLTPDAFFRHTKETRVQLLTGVVNVGDVLEAIKERNSEITSVCQAQVFDLGTSNAGSRALGTTLSDLFTNGIQAEAKAREDVLNARGGLVHQLIANNFPNDDNLPKLRFGAVQAVDLNKFAQALLWLSQAFPGLPPELQDWVRSETGMPEGTTEQVVVDAQKVPPVPAKVIPASTTPEEPAQGGAQASEAPHSHDGLQLAELRPPRGIEVYLNLAEMIARFDDSKTAIRVATQATRDALAAELAKRARAAAAKGELATFAAEKNPPMVDRLTADISKVLGSAYDAGQRQVDDELQRQKDGTSWSPESVGNRIAAAEKPKLSPQRLAKDAAIQQQAEMSARSLALTTQAASAMAAARIASGVPVDEAAMEAVIIRESDAAALRMVGVVSDIMQLGRADEAQTQASDIEDAVVSALLDGATCDECEQADGFTSTNLSEAEALAPNPGCFGGDRCRCVCIYELRQT